jgi:polysaccharide biosynthesis protein PslG
LKSRNVYFLFIFTVTAISSTSSAAAPSRAVCLSDDALGVVPSSCCQYRHNDGSALNGCAKPVSASYFGLNMGRGPKVMPTVPFQTWRYFWASWPHVELVPPVKGVQQFDFSAIDADVNNALAHGIKMQLMVFQSPTWWSTNPTAPPPGTCYYTSAPYTTKCAGWQYPTSSLTAWENYITAIATHYKGKVYRYELWNEIDTDGYAGTTDELAAMSRVAYKAFRAVDPTITVLTPTVGNPQTHFSYPKGVFTENPGLVNSKDLYFASVTKLKNQYGDSGIYSDEIADHYYAWPGLNSYAPETLVGDVTAAVATSVKYGFDYLPFSSSEAGWTYTVAGPTVWGAVSSSLIGSYIGRVMILGAYHGLRNYTPYAWNVGNFSMITSTGTELPSAKAYAQLQTWLVGKTPQSCTSNSAGIYTCAFLNSTTGISEHFVWSSNDEYQCFTPPTSWKTTTNVVLTESAATTCNSGKGLVIGPSPVWIH